MPRTVEETSSNLAEALATKRPATQTKSGRPDLNRRPLAPQASALIQAALRPARCHLHPSYSKTRRAGNAAHLPRHHECGPHRRSRRAVDESLMRHNCLASPIPSSRRQPWAYPLRRGPGTATLVRDRTGVRRSVYLSDRRLGHRSSRREEKDHPTVI